MLLFTSSSVTFCITFPTALILFLARGRRFDLLAVLKLSLCLISADFHAGVHLITVI